MMHLVVNESYSAIPLFRYSIFRVLQAPHANCLLKQSTSLVCCIYSTISCPKNEVKIYDAVFSSPDSETRTVYLNLFNIAKKPKLICV